MTATLTAPAPTPTRTLTAEDRCDRCGAQAYVAITVAHPGGKPVVAEDAIPASAGTELLFCAHHHTRHEVKLAEIGASKTVDETYKLKPTNRQQGASY